MANSYSRNNIFFGVRADILQLCAEKLSFLGFVQQYYCTDTRGYLDFRSGPFLGYLKNIGFSEKYSPLFRKFGFDHGNRRSFIDFEDGLQQRSRGGFRYFTPCFPNDPYCDQNFNPVGRYAQLPGGSRHRSRTANTSAAVATKSRWVVESLFCRESHLSLLGSSSEVPKQYLNPCGLPNFESQSILALWLHIGDSSLYHYATPYTYKYGTVDTYQDHGNDIRSRIELETPLSSLSGVQWSRNDIFRAPLGRNPLTRNGQPIVRVDLFDPQQTGMPAATMDELASVTLGSFQLRLVRSYSTSLR